MESTKTYCVTDGVGNYLDFTASSIEEAIDVGQDWIEDAGWEEGPEEYICEAWVVEVDEDGEDIGERVECHGVVPVSTATPATSCGSDESDHDWCADHDLVGGIEENPGVWGSGHGSVSTRWACRRCGLMQTTDYGATDSCGRQTTTVDYVEQE